MRTRIEIKTGMTTAFMANEAFAVKYGFPVADPFEDHFSIVSIENFWFEIVSFAMFLHEQMFDQHSREVDERLANQKAGTLPWYRTMALRFQYGFDLVQDKDYYDNSNHTDQEIALSKKVKYAAVSEGDQSSRVVIKIAGENAGTLIPLNADELEAFEADMNQIKFAGVQLTTINSPADRLFLNIQIKRNALVLNQQGMSRLNGNYPVNDAIREFMKELPFNGELRLSALVDKLQAVAGVLDATVISAESSKIDPTTEGYGSPEPIFISTIPFSGYFEVANYDNIGYVV